MKDFDVRKSADLAMLELKDEEISSLQEDMENIVSFAERIAEADVPELQEAISGFSLREDVVKTSLSVEEALSSAPEKRENCFFVPQVVE